MNLFVKQNISEALVCLANIFTDEARATDYFDAQQIDFEHDWTLSFPFRSSLVQAAPFVA